MLSLFLLSIIFILFLDTSFLGFFIICFSLFIYYLSNLNIFFNSRITYNIEFLVNDEISLFITFLLFFIIYLSYLLGNIFKSNKILSIRLLVLLFVCYQVFNTLHLFNLYFFYEASLIPILYIIIKWGSYPERSIRSIIMISYTLVFGVPMFIIIIRTYYLRISWFLPFMIDIKISSLVSIFIFLCFAVKLPIYGLHYWLPMAHVEAPTFGSVILARILLKLGGVGLYRVVCLIDLFFIKSFCLSYFIIFTVFSTIVCCFQSDFKRLIAYSSVSHIIVIPFLILSNNLLSIQSLIIIILFHGIRSTLIFIRVGILYFIFSSRQLVIIRGIVLLSPLIRLIIVLTFFYTLSAPPFPSYVAEVYFLLSRYILSSYMIYIFIPFVFLGLLYNLNWLRRILFRIPRNRSYLSSHIVFRIIIPFIIIIIITLILIPLFICF